MSLVGTRPPTVDEWDRKRNSYAACVGVAGEDFLKSETIVKNLQKFNNISVRESYCSAKSRCNY